MGGVALLGDQQTDPVDAPWASSLLALGARLARQGVSASGSRLVVALTVPVRDLAAVLIATGWVLTRPVKTPPPVQDVLRNLEPKTPIRMLNGSSIIAERFICHEVVDGQARVRIGGSAWYPDHLECVVPAPGLSEARFRRAKLAPPGGLVLAARRAADWRKAQVASGADLVLVGTKLWLTAEMDIQVGQSSSTVGFDRFGDVLRPDDGRCPAWGSAVLPATHFDAASIPAEARLAVLDGSSAIRWLNDLTTDVTVAIVDRSVPDTFAAESIVQLRSMGKPVSMADLGWDPPPGVEALAFEAWR
jgi:hypothetical protein